MLREGEDDDRIADFIRKAIEDKPGRHAFYEEINDHEDRSMNAIGG
jgi:molybdenum cofactor biosynthesis enzyme MoaA